MNYDINELIEDWIIDNPYPHCNDQLIIEKYENGKYLLEEVRKKLFHVLESSDYVRKKYLSFISSNTNNEDIVRIFNKIRLDLVEKYYAENNEISKESYEKMINVLIYNCYVH